MKNTTIHILAAVLLTSLLIFNSYAYGQTNSRKPNLKFQRIHEGLLSNQITALFEDHLGFLWVGTYSGLHRYDGIQFHIYMTSDNKKSINGNFVGSIYEDKNDNLWIGTGSGINRYNRKKDNFERFELPGNKLDNDSEENIVRDIIEDPDSTLWVSASRKGLYFLNKKKKKFEPYGNFDDKQINALAVGNNHILWVATLQHGLFKLNTETARIETTYTHSNANPLSIASDNLNAVKKDSDGSVWIGTANSGLDRIIKKNGKTIFRHYRHQADNPYSLKNNDIYTLYIDRTGKLWTGNENGGLHLYNRKDDSFYRYESDPNNPQSISHNSIWTVYQDHEKRYWIGTALSGINVADPYASKFMSYQESGVKKNGLNSNIVRDFLETKDDNLWIATDGGGLNYFNRKKNTFTAFTHNPKDLHSIGSNAIVDLTKDRNGNIWVGTWGGGANILTDQKKGKFISFQEKIGDYRYPIRNVFDIHFDQQYDRYVWLATFHEGLYRYDKKEDTLAVFKSDPEINTTISSNNILRIYEDSKNNIWLATNNGLDLLKAENKKKGIFKRFYHLGKDSTSLPSNSIRQIYEDSKKNIWVVTSSGLARYRPSTADFANYKKIDGLPTSKVKSIIEDNHGYLWIGTNRGLSRFDRMSNTFKNFNKSDGLQSNEFSRYSAYKLRSGKLLFGGMNGFNLFNPDSIKSNPYKPAVYFSDFKLFNKSVTIDDKDSPIDKNIMIADTVTLNYNQSVFTFKFIALNYTKPEQNQYAFKMEGFEKRWNYVGNQHNATYTNLDPGVYTFRVKASNNDGVWNEQGASIAVIIEPPFWQTTWFYFLSAMVIGGFIFGGYRYKVRQMRAQNKYLEQEITSRTSELNNRNKDLKAALRELQETKDELVEKAHKAGMADIATGVLHNIGNILNSVNTSSTLIDYIVKASSLNGLLKANALLRKHLDDIDDFIANNPKGKKLLEYYLKLEKPLEKEQEKIAQQTERLKNKIHLIKDSIAAQQNYAGARMDAEEIVLSEIVDDALALQAGSIDRHGLIIRKYFDSVDSIMAQRSKLIHVIVNLLKNAKEAMADNASNKKIMSIKIWEDQEKVSLSIKDNGIGIRREDMNKIFTYGFTTKKNGHGFGLHSSANYLKEMGGKIWVESNGKKQGATFFLIFKKMNNNRS